MNESQPPILEEKPKVNRFARFAAIFSIVTPPISFFIYFICIYGGMGLKAIAVVALIPISLIFLGFIFGIVALAMAKQRKGVLIQSITGICLNGLLLVALFGLPFFMAAKMGNKYLITPQGRLDKATKELATASNDKNKFYALDDAAKESFNVGKIQDAQNYANELLKMAPNYKDNWNYGNAVQDGNLVLGRIAVQNGHIEDAKKYLLEVGKSPGSPQMNSFGPNMSLAKDLLEKGEHDTVLQYFDQCRTFWKMDYGKLDEWSKEVEAGQVPDFGANLVY